MSKNIEKGHYLIVGYKSDAIVIISKLITYDKKDCEGEVDILLNGTVADVIKNNPEMKQIHTMPLTEEQVIKLYDNSSKS